MAEYSGEPITIDTPALRKIADSHDVVANHIGTARQAGDDIAAAVNTFGPIMWQVKAAMSETLTRRAAALGEHEQAHRTAASALLRSADLFDAQEEANAVRALNVSQD